MTETVETNFQKVQLFNQAFGATRHQTPQYEILEEDPKLSRLRYHLVMEEYNEFVDGLINQDPVEMLDALCDILYVVYGAFDSLGVNFDQGELKPAVIYHSYNYPIRINLGHFKKTVEDFSRAFYEDDFISFIESLYKIESFVHKLCRIFDFELDKAFDIVQQANMSKLCSSEEEAKESVEWYKKNESRYDSPAYRPSGIPNKWNLYNKSTGKALKSINFRAPEEKLKKLISEGEEPYIPEEECEEFKLEH